MKRIDADEIAKKRQYTKLPKLSGTAKRPTLIIPSPFVTVQGAHERCKNDEGDDKMNVQADRCRVSLVDSSAPTTAVVAETRGRSSLEKGCMDSGVTEASTSPKRTIKDVGGNTSQVKNRLRHDSEGKSKSKVESSNTTTVKESNRDSEQSASGKISSKPAQRQWSHENPLYGRHGRHPEDCRIVASNDTSCSRNIRGYSSQIPVVDVQPGVAVGKERNESRLQGASCADIRYAPDKKVMSYEEIYYQGRSVNPRQQQGQIPRPRHGILKDSGNKGSSRDSQDGSVYHYGSIDAFRENPYSHNPHVALRPNTSGPNSDQVSQQDYGSLPRGKKLSNPPLEGNHDRGSIPERCNPEVLSQHGYSYAKPSEEWRQRPTRRESDSGYSRASIDRDHGDNTYAVINYSKKRQIVCEAGNKNYAIVTHVHQPQRPDSVPPFTRESPEPVYGVTRPGSVPPSYYSDSETANYQRRSKPCGSREEVYGVLTTEYPGRARTQRNYETASDYAGGSSCSLRGRQEVEEKYRSGRRGVARRNGSVVSANRRYVSQQETEKKREAFMQLLAQRYPQYADKIQGVEAEAAVQALQQERVLVAALQLHPQVYV